MQQAGAVRRLLILVTEAGAAAFLRPVFRVLQQRSDLNWALAASPAAIAALAEDIPPSRLLRRDVDRRNADLATGLFAAADPSAVLVSAGGWPLERAMIRLAHERGRTTAQFVDTWYGYRRRMIDGENAFLPDYILVIDRRARAEAEEEGLPASRLRICGHPLWSEIDLLPATDSRATLFIGAPVQRDYADSLGYTEADSWECLLRVARERPDLVSSLQYAPHPEQRDIAVPVPIAAYSTGKLTEIGQVVGMFSAPLIEAYLAGRRSISLQPHAAAAIDMAPLSRFGLSPRVTDADQLVAALQGPIPDNSLLRADLANGTGRFISAIEDLVPA